MKPIEIHIEGYKIVISEDDKKDITYKPKKDDDDTISFPNYPHTVPCPYVPPTIQPQDEWWKYPYVTWTASDVTFTNTTDTKAQKTPVRDRMVGKDTDEVATD